MPENESSEAPPTPSGETPPTGQASTPPATGATEFRYGDDAPEYLRGKNQQETVAWVGNLVDEVKQMMAVRPQAAPQSAQVPMSQQIGMPDPDLAITDPKLYQQQLVGYMQASSNAQLAQYAAPILQQQASMAREMSKNDSANKAIFDKYHADIDAMVANTPAHMRTKALYDEAVIHVKGKRFDELAAEKAASLASAGTGLARSGGSDGESDTDDSAADVWTKIESSPMGKAALNVAGKKGILAAVRSGAYKSLEHYAEMASKSKARVDPANPSIIRDYVKR